MEKQTQTTSHPVKGKRLEEMSPEERLRSMQAFAEEQKYIQPGGGEIIPWNSASGEGGFNSVIFGNPLQGPTSFKMATDGPQVSLPPPSYNTATGAGNEGKEKERQPSVFKKLFGKQHEDKKEEGKEGKDGKDVKDAL